LKLFLHNTLSRSKDVFEPRSGSRIKLFTCGPSVYNLPHIGNYRTYLFEDVLERTLESLGYGVQRMLNFTDVEDKAVAEAKSRGLKSLSELTRPNEERFFRDAAELGIRIPEEIPRSSQSVGPAVQLIRRLLDRNHAYWHQGDVFFDPLTCSGFGRLYGLDMSRWPEKRVRFRKDTYPGQRWNLGDFILWHGGEPDDPYLWESEIGPGRPAWNIQDPAMISEHMGPELDICCGGVDNLYRHHDYNMAIMETAFGTPLAPFWLHGQHLLVDGAKMSKSKGNIVYPRDLFQKGWSSKFLRYFLLSRHYRSRLDLNTDSIDRAWSTFSRLRSLVSEVEGWDSRPNSRGHSRVAPEVTGLVNGVFVFLTDDLDVPSAIEFAIRTLEQLQAMKRDGQLSRSDQETILAGLARLDKVLGFVLTRQ
jgi:cysteinyl-tRNA synthetase